MTSSSWAWNNSTCQVRQCPKSNSSSILFRSWDYFLKQAGDLATYPKLVEYKLLHPLEDTENTQLWSFPHTLHSSFISSQKSCNCKYHRVTSFLKNLFHFLHCYTHGPQQACWTYTWTIATAVIHREAVFFQNTSEQQGVGGGKLSGCWKALIQFIRQALCGCNGRSAIKGENLQAFYIP